MVAKKPVKKKNPSRKVSGDSQNKDVLVAANKPVGFVRAPPLNVPLRRRRRGPLAGVWSFIVWLVGLLVSLAVGFGMVDGTLKIPYIPVVITAIAGWIVVILMLLGILLKIIDLASG